MKRFQFRLQPVLRYREWLEEEAKKALGREIGALAQLEAELRRLEAEHGSLLQERATGSLSALEHLRYIQYAAHLQERKLAQKVLIAEQQKRIEAAREALRLTVLERKKMERLRERRQAEYHKEVLRADGKVLDEVGQNHTQAYARTESGA